MTLGEHQPDGSTCVAEKAASFGSGLVRCYRAAARDSTVALSAAARMARVEEAEWPEQPPRGSSRPPVARPVSRCGRPGRLPARELPARLAGLERTEPRPVERALRPAIPDA